MRNSVLAGLAALAAIGLMATPALAQRDPAYAAAREALFGPAWWVQRVGSALPSWRP